MASYNDYDDRLTDEGNIAIALLSIAEALNKLADNVAKPKPDPQVMFKEELSAISTKVNALHEVVKVTYSAQDIEQIKVQLSQILLSLNKLLLKKESL